ncbi:hypothetical protein BVC80_881g19 [Macleaya cordata]|uniref:Mediator complex subunit 15 KIX domain-containing protein n=1 Tax=Macleaya cordata TaxID=56857 RepID=A0A200RD84_MACCD|nr:hypothetical protein BVC80_881g19 [Macleaya cordata]
MDSNNCEPAEAEQPNMETTHDWRNQLQPDSRQRIVSKIKEVLQRHLPISCPEGSVELDKIAVRFEEKIFAAATSLMLTMETKPVTSGEVNSLHSNSTGSSENP